MKKGLRLHLLYLSERLSFFKSLKKQTLYLRQVKILHFNEKEEKWTENLNVPMTHFWCQDKNCCGLLEPQKVARNKMGPKRRGWICLQKEKPDKHWCTSCYFLLCLTSPLRIINLPHKISLGSFWKGNIILLN